MIWCWDLQSCVADHILHIFINVLLGAVVRYSYYLAMLYNELLGFIVYCWHHCELLGVVIQWYSALLFNVFQGVVGLYSWSFTALLRFVVLYSPWYSALPYNVLPRFVDLYSLWYSALLYNVVLRFVVLYNWWYTVFLRFIHPLQLAVSGWTSRDKALVLQHCSKIICL